MTLPTITPEAERRRVVNLDGQTPPAPPEALRDDWRDWSISYALVRYHFREGREVLALGLTFAQATRHCALVETSGRGWFDGFAMCTKGEKCER